MSAVVPTDKLSERASDWLIGETGMECSNTRSCKGVVAEGEVLAL